MFITYFNRSNMVNFAIYYAKIDIFFHITKYLSKKIIFLNIMCQKP